MKKNIIVILLLIIFTTGLFTGEKKLPELPKTSGIRGAANFIVATVDEEVILFSDVQREFAKWSYVLKSTRQNIPSFNFETKKIMLKRTMEDIFYLIYAKKNQLEVSEAQVSKRLHDIKSQYNIESDDELVLAVSRVRMMGHVENINQIRLYFRKLMLINRAKSHLIRSKYRSKLGKASEAEMKKFYKNNPKYFYGPPKVKLQHLVIKLKENADFDELEKTEKKLKSIVKSAKSGESFTGLVNKYASEAYKSNSGFISNQFLKKGELKSLFPKYVKYAFTLGKGGVSKVIIDGNKRIILKVVDKKEKQLRPYVEVKNIIKRFIYSQRGKVLLKDWINKQYRVRLIKIKYDRLRVSE